MSRLFLLRNIEDPNARAGDTVRLELDLDGQWGGTVASRFGNRVKMHAKKGPGTRATLTAYNNGERVGTVVTFETRPRTSFVWLVEMVSADNWVQISRPEGQEFGYGGTSATTG
jgi:hypothetical protein